MEDILELIKLIRESFPQAVEVYTKGSCVRFALILKKVYPEGDLLYNEDHCIFKYKGKCYDITGEVKEDGSYINIEYLGILKTKKLLDLKYENSL